MNGTVIFVVSQRMQNFLLWSEFEDCNCVGTVGETG